MNICLIPARSGSKRIPNKNKKLFLGKPIIEYALETAEKTQMFDLIVISTDDHEIKDKYQSKPIKILDRSEETANDTATLTDVLIEIISHLEGCGIIPDQICILLPCSIFVDYTDLLNSYESLDDIDCIFSVCEYRHPTIREFGVKNNKFVMLHQEAEFLRTQDLQKTYHDAGQFYWINVAKFKEQGKIFMKNLRPYCISAVDIDTEDDWILAEAILGYTRILER